jgi:hypothetical protein
MLRGPFLQPSIWQNRSRVPPEASGKLLKGGALPPARAVKTGIGQQRRLPAN